MVLKVLQVLVGAIQPGACWDICLCPMEDHALVET